MDTASGFIRGEASRGNRVRVFDWDKAARLIGDQKVDYAGAGLQSDWEYTGGVIFNEGVVTEGGTYLASTWAIPELDLDGEMIDCWIYADETDGWDAKTIWPESARAILNGE